MSVLSKRLLLFLFTLTTFFAYGQNEKSSTTFADISNIYFRDTIFNLAFDSTSHNLGSIVPTNGKNRLVKYFKYVGTEPIVIHRTLTTDPHFICDYPREPLIPGRIYSITICFWHQNGKGNMIKTMGFELSNNSKISLKFTGTYLTIAKN